MFMKKFLSLILVLILCLSIAAPGVSYASTIQLSKSKLDLNVGNSYKLRLSVASGTIQWKSSDKLIATVSSNGKVTAVAKGKTTITATVESKKYKCSITVNDPKVDIIYSAYIFDDQSIEEYVKEYKEGNPQYSAVKVYDENHIIVTMLESERLNLIKEINEKLDEVIYDKNYDDVFINIKADKLFQNIKVYADKDKYEDSFSVLGLVLLTGILSDIIQAINFIDVDERDYNLTVIDSVTGEILDQYPGE